MTDEDRRLIASLKNDRAYLTLLAHLDEEVSEMLTPLENADKPAEIMQLTRVWQVARKLLNRLRYAPEAMHQIINDEQARPAGELRLFGEDDNPFINVWRPVPPTAQSYNSDAKINLEQESSSTLPQNESV